jgi:beta-lactamase class A
MDRAAFLTALAASVTTPPPGLIDGPAPDVTPRGRKPDRTFVEHAPFAAQERRGRGRLGVAAIDLRDGRRIEQRGDERFPMASTFKLPLVMAVLSRVDRVTERLDRAIAFKAGDLVPYSPVVGQQPHGGHLTVAELCAAAIEVSDNTAANLLLRTVGGPAGVTAYVRGLGDRVTRLDRTEPALNESIPGDVRDTTTPYAMAALVTRLVRDPVLSPSSKSRIFGWLRGSKTGAARIRAGVPPSWTVGDKTGTTDTSGNDVAILWPRTAAHAGRESVPIVLAVYCSEMAAPDAERDAVIADVARMVVRRLRP